MTPDRTSVRLPGVALRNLDLVVVVIATIPALALGAPVFGYLMGAGGWIFQRVVHAADRRFVIRGLEAHKQLWVSLFERFGRIWLMAGAIVIAGAVGKRTDGLTAAIVIFAAYSIAFAIRLLAGPPPARSKQ